MTTINSSWFIKPHVKISFDVIQKESTLNFNNSDSPGTFAYGNSTSTDNIVKKNFAKVSHGKQSTFSLFGNSNSILSMSGPQKLQPLARPDKVKFYYAQQNKTGLRQLQTSASGF